MMTKKYKILANFIKDMSSETTDIKSYLFVKENISKYQLNIDITSHALKNKMIEVRTILKFEDKELNEKKSYFEIVYSSIIKIDEDIKEKKILEKKLKKICDRHNKSYYKKYKKWCDKYFYLPHRKETRGIGGIFFDYKKDNWEKDFKFICDLGVTFQMIFNSMINKKYKKKWTAKEKELQYIKRGRYAEFNLLHDRGTKFGLQTGGNVEGILMSLPPMAKWN